MEIIYKLDDFPEPGDRDLFKGIQEINKNNYKEALKHFEKGSNYDNEYASLFTAVIYLTGFDLPKRYPEKAMKLLKKIASKWKNQAAQYLIAVMYDDGDEGVIQNKTASTEWYLLSASNGWILSIANVGFADTYGRGIKEDHKKAIEWIEKILKYEDSEAKKKDNEILYLFGNKRFELILTKADQSMVAYVREMTQSAMPSPVTVFCEYNYKNPSWPKIVRILIWDILSDKKSGAITSCQNYMTNIYLSGKHNIPRDTEKAMYWQVKAANSGNSRSCLNMGFQYEIGTYLKQDYKEAMRWYIKAVDISGDAVEIFRIASLYYRGLGVEKDWRKALYHLERAVSDEKYKRAYLLMGIIYEKGKYGVSRDIKKAVVNYMKEFDLGNPNGANAMALIHCRGLDGKRDEEMAIHWFTKAALKGCLDAPILLRLINGLGFKSFTNMMPEVYDIEANLFTKI